MMSRMPNGRLWTALCAGVFLVVLAWSHPARATPRALGQRVAAAHTALNDWQLSAAKTMADALLHEAPEDPAVLALLGRVKFHEGDYEGATRFFAQAEAGGVQSRLAPLAQSTADEARGQITHRTAHFDIRVPAGKDEVLLPWAERALEQAYDALTKAYAYAPKHRIVVDVWHDAAALARASSLTEAEIRTSGTIALCKYNRLMITSPKALARGYGWLDTLSHELVHLIVSEKSKNTVPIWLHEGLAKYSESMWRGAPGLALSPASEKLLATHLNKKDLVTFAEMHPSMAKLPSQEHTALAFAEVFTAVAFVHDGAGVPGAKPGFSRTNAVIDALRDGATLDKALRGAIGVNLAGFERRWRASLARRKFRLVPGARPRRLSFVKNARGRRASSGEVEGEAALDDTPPKARRAVRLGHMLYTRGRHGAAAVKYAQAVRASGRRVNPALFNRLAALHLKAGKVKAAERLLSRVAAVYPDDARLHILRGRAAVARKAWNEAATAYDRAAWENPFDPEIHMGRIAIADATGDDAGKKQAESALRKLSAHGVGSAPDVLAAPAGAGVGLLHVMSLPWGAVSIDGVETGVTTPARDVPLKVGAHDVLVTDPVTGKSASARVNITADAPAELKLELRATPARAAAP